MAPVLTTFTSWGLRWEIPMLRVSGDHAMIHDNFCHDCERDITIAGHSGDCVQITSEFTRIVPRTSRLSQIGAPKVSGTWKTPKRRASAVVTRKLRKDGRTIDRRFKPKVG